IARSIFTDPLVRVAQPTVARADVPARAAASVVGLYRVFVVDILSDGQRARGLLGRVSLQSFSFYWLGADRWGGLPHAGHAGDQPVCRRLGLPRICLS